MKRLVALVILLLAPSITRADLAGDINAVLHDKLLGHAQESVEIVRLNAANASPTMLFRHEAESPRIPASNLKVVTTSAALDRFGPNFKFQTKLVFHDGDLILIGDGDPSFGDAELLSRMNWDVNTVYRNWTAQMAKLNLKTVRDVIVDDSIFDQTMVHPHWSTEQVLKRYSAEVAGLDLNANCLDCYVKITAPGKRVDYMLDPQTTYINFVDTCITGNDNAVWLSRTPGTNDVVLRGQAKQSNLVPISITINDPPLFAGTVLSDTLKANGIIVTGNVHRDRSIRDQMKITPKEHPFTTLAVHETPIQQVMARANKDSMNLYAECVCKRLGAEVTGQPGSWTNGTAAVGAFLTKIGVPAEQFHLDDGCGLSKFNGISANAMITVLAYDRGGPNAKFFQDTLAVAGVDGTLDDRFRSSDLRGRLFGKSGYVNTVSSLSGYLHAKDDQWYAFSILMNGVPPSSNTGAKALQDRIVKALDTDTAMAAVDR